MAAPSFVDAGTGATDAGGVWSYTCQAGAAGDIYIVQILKDGATSYALSVAVTGSSNINNLAGSAGWTWIENTDSSSGAFLIGIATTYQALYIGRATSTSAPTISGTNSTSEDLYIRSYRFQNVSTGTTLATVIENGIGALWGYTYDENGTITDAGVTTLGPDRLALQFIGISDDNALAAFTGETGGDWIEAVAEYAEASGTDATIGLQVSLSPWTDLGTGYGNFSGNVAYGNGYFVAPGWYRADTPAGTWTAETSITTPKLAYGNGYWVGVGDNGLLKYRATTPNGTWTTNSQGSTTFNSVAYGNGYWVAVGANGTVYYKATDPTGTWTSNTQGSTTLNGVSYGNGYWCAVGASGSVLYRATDPTGAWTSNTQGIDTRYDVAYNNGYWVAVGATGSTLTYKATDPTGVWTANNQGSSTLTDIWYGDGFWMAVGDSAAMYMKAVDPIGTWNSVSSAGSNYTGVAYGNGYWCVVGLNDGTIRYMTVSTPIATTIDGGTTSNADATDGWGVVGFALIGTTPNPTSPPPNAIARKDRRIVTLI